MNVRRIKFIIGMTLSLTFFLIISGFYTRGMAGNGQENIRTWYSLGVLSYSEGYLPEARKQFKKVMSVNPRYKKTSWYMKSIRRIDYLYSEARTLYSHKKYEDALNLFTKVLKYYPDSQYYIIKCRSRLRKNIHTLEEQLIWYFARRQYKKCIVTARKILSINPEHKAAQIYLPKALKRQKAVEKLSGH
jgi:tetratricopeptide (TPR) repeat protein